VNDRRIVVTGLGVVSPLALDAPSHFARLLNGDSAVERLTEEVYRNYPPVHLARVQGFDRHKLIGDRMLRKLLAPSPSFALASAGEALRDSGITADKLADCGLYIGSVCLDANPEAFIPALRESVNSHNEVDLARFATQGMKLVDPLFLVKSLPNAGLCAIAIQHQVLGPNANFTNGAVSGMDALIAAMTAIERGDAEVAIAGGYDSLLRMDSLVDHLLAGRLASDRYPPARACRPFDRERSGYAVSEGAACVVLEAAEHAQMRSARIYGELCSFGQAASARGLIEPDADGEAVLAAAARQALDAAGWNGAGVDVVFGAGMATARDDAQEARAYESVFKHSRPAFTCHTGSFGFTGAAAGVFSLVHAMKAIRDGVVPHVINCDDPDPALPIPVVRQPCTSQVRRAIAWISDRGVKTAAVAVSRWDDSQS
jgi:3-oxoacyl-[acyl-carrier-protein] synthase II